MNKAAIQEVSWTETLTTGADQKEGSSEPERDLAKERWSQGHGDQEHAGHAAQSERQGQPVQTQEVANDSQVRQGDR